MTSITTSKEINGEKVKVTVNYDFGENLDEARQKFGDEVVYSNYRAHAIVTIQSIVRRGIVAGKTPEAIQDEVSGVVLGVARRTSRDPVEAFYTKFQGLDKAAQADLIKKLKAATKK